MDFDDDPSDIEFGAECREWLSARASLRSDRLHVGGILGESDADAEADAVKRAREWQATLADGGWAGIAWPGSFGGRGGTARQQAIFDREMGRFEVPPNVFGQGISMAGPTIIVHGTEEQKIRFLPPMLRGDEIWCQLFSEPGAGSDLASLSASAVLDGDQYVVNGQKVWTSSAQFSDWGILLARTDPSLPKHKGISYFLVDMTSPGIDVRPLRQITGVAHFNEVFLTDVKIPVANVLGPVNEGWKVAMTTLMNERAMIGGGGGSDVGQELVDLLCAGPHRHDPVHRDRVMDAYIRNRVLTYLGYRARTRVEQGLAPGPETSVLKLAYSTLLPVIADVATALVGPEAMCLDYEDLDGSPWQSRFLMQWASRIGGGTEAVQRNIVGERVLGLPREPQVDRERPFSRRAS